MTTEERQKLIDARTEKMASILAAFPTTPTAELAKRYNVSASYIRMLAHQHGVYKDHDTRSKEIEKVDGNGKVVAVYSSANKCSKAERVSYNEIRRRVEGKTNKPLKGYYFRVRKKTSRRMDDFDLDFSNIEDDDYLY